MYHYINASGLLPWAWGIAVAAVGGVIWLLREFFGSLGGEKPTKLVEAPVTDPSDRPASARVFAPRSTEKPVLGMGHRVDLTSSVMNIPISGNWAVVCELLDGYPSRAMFISRSGRQRVTAPVVRCDGTHLYLRHGNGEVFKRRMYRTLMIHEFIKGRRPS